MKNLIVVILLVFSFQIQNYAQVSLPLLHLQSKTDTLKANHTQFSLSAGAFVMGNKQNAFYGSYVMPMVRFYSDKRFSYGFGASISTSNFNSGIIRSNEEKSNLLIQPRINNTIFVYGSYQVNDKIQVNGSVYQQINPNAIPSKHINFNNPSSRGINFNIFYKASETSTFQFDFNYSKGNQGLYPYNMNTRSNFNQVPSNYFYDVPQLINNF